MFCSRPRTGRSGAPGVPTPCPGRPTADSASSGDIDRLARAFVLFAAHPLRHHAGLQEAPDDAQQAFVANAPGHAGHQECRRSPGRRTSPGPGPRQSRARRPHTPGPAAAHRARCVRGGSRSSIPRRSGRAAAPGLRDRLLHQTVHHRRDAQLAHPATRLRICSPRTGCGWSLPSSSDAISVSRLMAIHARNSVLTSRHARCAAVRLHPLVGPVQVRRASHFLHQLPRQGSFMVPCRRRLWLL